MLKFSVYTIIGISLAFTLYRVFRGPGVLDRLLGYSSFSAKVVILLVTEGLLSGSTTYVNLALTYAVLSFLGIVIIARYVEREV